jgi:predicted DNA-binding protein (UPF0251 family)
MSQNTEHDWVERAEQGEPAGIAELYRRYWRAARAAAYGVTGDLSLAENLEQQELAALIREAVASLPAILREAISLFYFEGYSVEDAARFLGVPAGTLKRRLHDGRQRLQSAAEHILEGRKPMDPEREQILRQIREAAAEGLNSDAFYQVIRKSLDLRPVPRELLQEIRKHYYEEAIRKRGQAPLLSPE